MNRHTTRSLGAFTLTELLVVITVIVLLFTVAAPNFNKMIRSGIEDSAVSVISAATATARVYATQKQSFLAGEYQGTALLFTPSGEVRVVRHVENAADNGSPAERLVDKNPPLAGFEDLPTEDRFSLPDAVGVVGVIRGNGEYLFPPPFALRYNANGMLVSRRDAVGSSGRRAMYYDGNHDGKYSVTSLRTSSYNPNESDPRSDDYLSANFDSSTGKIRFGIEGVDTVAAVIAFNLPEFRAAGFDLKGNTTYPLGSQGELHSSAVAWLKANGRVIYFNRYTGTAITP